MASLHQQQPPQAPIKFFASPELLLQSTKDAIANCRKAEDDIVASVSVADVSFEDVMLPLMHVQNEFFKISMPAHFLADVSEDAELCEASRKAQKLMRDYSIESSMREDIFRLVKAVVEKREPLEGERAHCLDKEYRAYIRNGLNLPSAHRQQFKDIKKRMAERSLDCMSNFTAEKVGLWLSAVELRGLPQNTLSGLKKGEKGSENEGKFWMTFKPSDYEPAMKYVEDPGVRKSLFLGFENKCNVNKPLLRELYILRDERARLLGYKHNAALKIEDSLAGSEEFVSSFLNDLRAKLKPASKELIQDLLDIKTKHLKSCGLEGLLDGKLYLWEATFYIRLMIEQQFSLDQDKVSEYLPLDGILPKMFVTFEKLFGLRFVSISDSMSREMSNGRNDIWHEDVKVYQLWNSEGEGGSFLGHLYLDLHPRDFKYSHPCHIGLQPGFEEDGTRHYPSSLLLCSFTKPLKDKPSLLKHKESISLFHELGHAIHNLVSKTEFGRFHGLKVARDFLEAPSKMLEHWFWDATQLKVISTHYSYLSPQYLSAWEAQNEGVTQPPRVMPDEMISGIVKSRYSDSAYFRSLQVFYSIYDMTVHSPKSHEEVEGFDIQRLYNKLRHEITLIHGPDEDYTWGNNHAKFTHQWGKYDASYYGYELASSISADMFEAAFAKDPMDPEQGRRYRYTVLQPGGSQPEMKTLENFLGRKPNNEAWMRQLGFS